MKQPTEDKHVGRTRSMSASSSYTSIQPQTYLASPLTPSKYDPVYVPSRRSSSIMSNKSSKVKLIRIPRVHKLISCKYCIYFLVYKLNVFLLKSTIDILCENAISQSLMLRKSTSSSSAFPMYRSSYSTIDRFSRSRIRRADSPPIFPPARSQSAMSHISLDETTHTNRIYHQGLPPYNLRRRLQSFNSGVDKEEIHSRYYLH